MKFDRGMIKWQPFDSVISSKSLLNQEDVTLQYYWNGYLQVLTGKIKKIDRISKIIYLNSQRLFFKQIVAILT